MIFHCDGSANRTGAIAWGIVAQHGGEHTELSGSRTYPAGSDLSHACELVAVVEAIRHAHWVGVPPEKTSFHTDAQSIVHALGHHNVEAWGGSFRVRPSLQHLLNKLVESEAMPTVMAYLERSHFAWVKGHADSTMNRRADHIARQALRGGESTPYDEWLAAGFTRIRTEGPEHWQPPFIAASASDIEAALEVARRHWADGIARKKGPHFRLFAHMGNLGAHLLEEMGIPETAR